MSERIGTMKKVRKAVIPVAGLGTRFLPATKSMPKEMLPVVDRPVVQYAVDEALEAGIEHIVFVTGRNKAVIEDYFDLHPELVGTLEQAGKVEQIRSLESLLPIPGATSFTRQQAPHGLGHAVWCARDIIGDEPFALLLPDMVSFGKRGCLAEIMDLHAETGGNVIAVEQCDPSETNKYGIVGKGPDVGSGFEVTAMVEKPAPASAPSNFYINGRYILQPEIFNLLGTQKPVSYTHLECLDIHRLVLREDILGKGLRGAERLFGRNVGLLLTSSPAFVRHYFERFGQIDAPIELVENKLLELEQRTDALPLPAQAGEPWKIGWFGALRCRKSLELLADFTRKMEGRFEVVLRGRPALSEFADFHGFVESEPHLAFKGAYRNPEDMADIYAQAHFAWAIDFFEEGQNSTWLLPNRLYEGCRFGTVPIAMAGTETARFLERLDIGLVLPEPSATALADTLSGMTSERYAALRGAVLARDPGTWICGLADCRALVAKLERVAAQNGESLGAIAA